MYLALCILETALLYSYSPPRPPLWACTWPCVSCIGPLSYIYSYCTHLIVLHLGHGLGPAYPGDPLSYIATVLTSSSSILGMDLALRILETRSCLASADWRLWKECMWCSRFSVACWADAVSRLQHTTRVIKTNSVVSLLWKWTPTPCKMIYNVSWKLEGLKCRT